MTVVVVDVLVAFEFVVGEVAVTVVVAAVERVVTVVNTLLLEVVLTVAVAFLVIF